MMSVPERCYASIPKRTSSKRRKRAFHCVESDPWYTACSELGDRLESELEELHKSLYTKLENDVIDFIERYKCSTERVPVITLFTGINLPDHNSLLSMIANRILEESRIRSRVVVLNEAKSSTVKSLIEDTIYNFLAASDSTMENSDFEHGDVNVDINRLKKSECTFHRLAKWYRDNFGLDLNDTNSDRSATYLIIVIPDILLFPKRILNTFVRLLSVFRDRLPFIFLVNVPTTREVIHKTFSKDVESKLAIYPFQSQSPTIFLDRVLDEIFLTPNWVFQIGANPFQILIDSFLSYNLSVTEFIKGITFCLKEHFLQLDCNILDCTDEKIEEKIDLLEEDEIDMLLKLRSMEKYNAKLKMDKKPQLSADSPRIKIILKKLYREFRRDLNRFHLAIRCLHVILKLTPENTIPIREHYIRLMNPEKRSKWLEEKFMTLKFISKETLLETLESAQKIISYYAQDDENITRVNSTFLKSIEDIEKSQLISVKNSPAKSPSKTDFGVKCRRDMLNALQKNAQNRSCSEFDEAKKKFLDYLRNDFLKVYLKSFDDAPLRELFIFDDDNGSKLRFLYGVPRAGILTALENPVCYLECDCCCDALSNEIETLPDLSLLYKLHTEYGNKINMYDWFQQFRSKVDKEDFTDNEIDSEIYGRFLQGVRELHHLGFITLPKSRANFVEYVTKLTV